MEFDNIIFHINGGIGKNVSATAVLKAIKKTYPDNPIYVLTGWPEIFKFDPNVERVFRFGATQYFYEDNIKRGNPLILAQEVYLSTQHIIGKKPLYQSWIEMYGMEYEGEMPELHFNFRHHQTVRQSYKRDKPTIIMQTNGGAPDPEGKRVYSWARDMPLKTAQKIVARLKDKYHVFQVCYNEQQVVQDAEPIQNLNEMEIYALTKTTKGRVLIDSCIQHGAGAMNLPSTVLWIANEPEVWSYPCHSHIKPNAELKFNTPAKDLYARYDISGATDEYPYETDDIFDVDEIVSSVEKQIYESDVQ